MEIIKQTDTPTEGANVYADLDDLESHASLRGIDLSSFTDDKKKSTLYVTANDWVDSLHDFKGELIEEDQSMKLPTSEVLINKDIVSANCFVAIQELNNLLFKEVSEADINGQILKESSKLDVLEESFEYAEGSQMLAGSTYDTTQADARLKPYLSYGSGIPTLRI